VRIKDRIRIVLEANGGRMSYCDLLDAVFPVAEYPDSRRHSSNGGPPGCAMALGRALREVGCYETGLHDGGSRMVVLAADGRKE
jgi:hypothetical protein